MSVLDPIKPYLALIKTGLFVAIVAAAFVYGCSRGQQKGNAEVERLKAAHATTLADIKSKTAEAAEKARTAEIAVARAFAKVHTQHTEALNQAKQHEQDTVAALNARHLRLRREWTCPEMSGSPGVAGYSGTGDDAAELRHAGAGALVRVGDSADADIAAWQARWEAWRIEYDAYRESLK